MKPYRGRNDGRYLLVCTWACKAVSRLYMRSLEDAVLQQMLYRHIPGLRYACIFEPVSGRASRRQVARYTYRA